MMSLKIIKNIVAPDKKEPKGSAVLRLALLNATRAMPNNAAIQIAEMIVKIPVDNQG